MPEPTPLRGLRGRLEQTFGPRSGGYVVSQRGGGGERGRGWKAGRGGLDSDMLNQFLQGQNSLAQQRYQQLQQQIADTQARVRGTYEKMGQEGRARIGEAEQRGLASTQQDLISRGLGNTTVVESARRGVMSDAERQRQALDSLLAEQMGGLELSLGQLGLQGFQQAPDMTQFIQLLQMLGGL